MQKVEIDFCPADMPGPVFTLTWTLTGELPSLIWFKLFCKNLESEKKFFNRFTGFTNGPEGISELLTKLDAAIATINNDGRYQIPERAQYFTQDFSNAIHHHFEILIGSTENPNPFFVHATPAVQEAVVNLNYLVHDLEAYTRNLEFPESAFAGVINEVPGCERFVIPAEFDQFFSLNFGDGDLVAHYSQIGKTWLEAFYDQDEDASPEAIRPLYAFSGEFDLMFGRPLEKSTLPAQLNAFLIKRGKNPEDPSLRLGHLVLARLNASDLNLLQIKEKLALFNSIRSIRAVSSGRIIAAKDF